MNASLRNRFRSQIAPKLYSQRNTASPLVYYKIKGRHATWLITEATQEENDVRFFGYVASESPEWRYFNLSDLERDTTNVNLDVTELSGINLAKALADR